MKEKLFKSSIAVLMILFLCLSCSEDEESNYIFKPKFNPADGNYTQGLIVEITSATYGTKIYYTTDGSFPTSSSMIYDAPIPVNQTTTLKARAYKDGIYSSVATAEYEIDISATMASFSDPHYFDPELVDDIDGDAFKDYLAQDRKLIAESHAILEATVNAILATDTEIVLVPGDLTKDGELSSHQNVAGFLQQLEDAGKQVFTVPGNHDINNPHAVEYVGSGQNQQVAPVPTVTPEEFADIYANFGYAEALERDPNSLSYVAQPKNGLWIMGMDPCRYQENDDHPVTGGHFSEETLDWILSKLEEAQQNNITVFGMMHHGIYEHYVGQSQLFYEYVVEDWQNVSAQFANMGMKIVFTGHYHSQDIVKSFTHDIWDIETGSTVTYPCPYRLLQLNPDHTLDVSTEHITDINYDTGALDFQDYARNFLQEGLSGIVIYMMIEEYGISQEEAAALEPFLTEAMMAHYEGDENIAQAQPGTLELIQSLQEDEDPIKQLLGGTLYSLWTDPMPGDNETIIHLVE